MNDPVALDVLRRLGYVHRDVSPGNILLYEGRGILADMEYAKHQDDTSTHDVRSVSGSQFISVIN